MSQPNVLSDASLKQLFTEARTANGFKNVPISDVTLHALYDLLKWGPTAFNAQPARFVFVRSGAAKEKLKPALSARALRSTVKLVNSRTGWSSRSGGTATKWDALPMSMPAAFGWVMLSAAPDLPGLRLTLQLRWVMACSIFVRLKGGGICDWAVNLTP